MTRRSARRASKKAAAKPKAAKKGLRMGYSTGDRVKAKVDLNSIKKGTTGTVVEPVPEADASKVRFDGHTTPRLVPNEDLEPA